MNTEARDEVAAGFRYAHFRADANTGKLLEVASFLYAAIDMLSSVRESNWPAVWKHNLSRWEDLNMPEALAAKSSKGKDPMQTQAHTSEVARQFVPTSSGGAVLALQRSAGNHSVNHLLGQGVRGLPSTSGILQRKCACGNNTMAGGECDECGKKQRLSLQTKLKVNEPGDIYEQEADRIADQVMATPAHHAVSGAPIRIQRFLGQSNGRLDGVPASVDRALASPGRPLEPALRMDMEQRFGHDFTRVRVHPGAAAEQSAQDVNANAYTMGHDIVFGTGRFAPGTHEGRRLIAHELAHVVQQSGAKGTRVGQSGGNRGLSPISTAAAGLMRHPADEGLSAPPVPAEPINGGAMSPAELVKYIIDQRGFHSAAPRFTTNTAGEQVLKRGSVTPAVDPLGIGKQLGLGFETHAIVQVFDAKGNLVATELGAFTGSYQTHAPKGVHAEAQGLKRLLDRLINVDVSGGTIVAAVDQNPCLKCASEFHMAAESLGLKGYEVYGPGRESLTTPGRSVSPKTAARTAYMGGPRPGVTPELIAGASFLSKRGALQATTGPFAALRQAPGYTLRQIGKRYDLVPVTGTKAPTPEVKRPGARESVGLDTKTPPSAKVTTPPKPPSPPVPAKLPTTAATKPPAKKDTPGQKPSSPPVTKKLASPTTPATPTRTDPTKAVVPTTEPVTTARGSTLSAETTLTADTIAREVAVVTEGRGRALVGKISSVGGRAFAVLKFGGTLFTIYSLTQIRSLNDAGAFAAALGVSAGIATIAKVGRLGTGVAAVASFALMLEGEKPPLSVIESNAVYQFLFEYFPLDWIIKNRYLLEIQAYNLLFNTKPFVIEPVVPNPRYCAPATTPKPREFTSDEVMRFVRDEVAAIRTDVMIMGDTRAGVLIAIDKLKVAQQTTSPAVALKAVQDSFSILEGQDGVGYLYARLEPMQVRLGTLIRKYSKITPRP